MGFLNGDFQPVIRELEEKMNRASENLEFEKAIEYRELLNSVRAVAQKQKITSADGEDRDVMALAMDQEDAVAVSYTHLLRCWITYRRSQRGFP